ncbi:zinc ribbon domain-containing protein [Myroides sp. NP-2]|uniref:zinc ribbon domain-containing protein n=1 Tax=Myroides sp. NP-2 TaxID=2759945 RepID=UPI0015FE6412|nr:zinc ribbon domain-containing protein [Myroides sp. NP-2]MBB1148673.1 zinc ribbon domain-containing protein [Myroides sp. NP-2]
MKIICQNCDTENVNTSKYCSNCGYQLPKIEIETATATPVQTEKEKPKKKMPLASLLGIIFGVLLIVGVSQYFLRPTLDIDETLAVVASEINKNYPMYIDQDLRMDNTMAMPNKTLQYNYTIVNYAKEELNMEVVESTLFTGILENIQTNPDLKEMRDAKVTFNYYYKDKNGVYVTKYVVTPDMYAK